MFLIKAGSTSFRGYWVRIVDATTGAPYTGATSATAGAAFGYTRPGSTRTSISLSDLAAVDSAYSSGGIKHIAAGWYRLDVPDAALATGVDDVLIEGAFTAYTVISPRVQLTGFDPRTELTTAFLASTPQTGDSFARIGALGAGLTAVPWNAAWDAEVQSEAADALAATDAIGAASISAAAGAKIADIVLRRTAANIEASANGDTLSIESLYGLVMAAFEAALSGTTLTIRKSDATTLGTKTVTVDADADPITGIT